LPDQTFPNKSTVVREGLVGKPSGAVRYSPRIAPVFASIRMIVPLPDAATLTKGNVEVFLMAFTRTAFAIDRFVLISVPRSKSALVV
jgi:hypothetical protein